MLEGGGVVGWAVLNGGFGGAPAVSRKTSSPCTTAKPGLNFNNTSGSAGQVYYGAFGSAYSGTAGVYLLPVKNGDRVQVAARVLELTGSCNGALIRAVQCDTAGAAVAELSPTAGLTVPVTVTAAGRLGCLATASQDGFIAIIIYAQKASATTAAGGLTIDEMFISKARSGQVDIDPYTPGPGSEFGADVTLTHTSAAIIGQGWGATASEAAARATRGRGLLNNSRFQVPFTNGAVPTSWSDWVNGATDFTARPAGAGDGYCAVRNGIAGANTGIVQQVAVKASTPYVLVAEVRRGSGTFTGAGILVEYYTSGFAWLGSAAIYFATDATTDGSVSSSPDAMVRYEKLITTPATCAYMNVYAMDHYTSLGSVAAANQIYWSELDLIPLSLVAQLRADITASNTSAAIAGQGNFATSNFVRQASAPSTAEGKWWVDTTNNQLKLYTGGAWQVIADISGTAFSATHNGPASGSRLGAGYVGSNTVTITPANGTGPYTYRWSITDNANGISLNAVDGVGNNTYSIGVTITAGVTWRATVICDITDSIGRTIRVSIYDNVLYDAT